MFTYKRIIDISQPVRESSATFPGDTAFKRDIVLTHADSKVVNLTAFTMSPHVGTHVDAPAHIKGSMDAETELVGALPLHAFVGACLVLDLSPTTAGISWKMVQAKISSLPHLTERILFKTQTRIRYDVFEKNYAYFETDLVKELSSRGVKLMGIDAPSADHVRSKTLDAHHELDRLKMSWLENLDLTHVSEGEYFLVALPLKFMELEASPVRAVLLDPGGEGISPSSRH